MASDSQATSAEPRPTSGIPRPLIGLAVWIGVLLVWQAAHVLIRLEGIFPSPRQVFDAFAAMLGRGATQAAPAFSSPLMQALLASGLRLLIGFVLTAIIGVALGVLLWRSPMLDHLLGPVMLGLQALPSVCWVPLAVLLPGLGVGERAIIFVVVMGSTFAIALAMRDGLRQIPDVYRRCGLMLGARSWRLYLHVVFPASLPALASAVRLGFSFAWRSLMGAEVLFAIANTGLGFLLAGARGDAARIVAVMIVMVVVGMLADRWLFARIQSSINARFGLS